MILIPQSPSPRRDTIEFHLECGHRKSYAVLSSEDGSGQLRLAESRMLIGTDLACAKCRVVEMIRSKRRPRRMNGATAA